MPLLTVEIEGRLLKEFKTFAVQKHGKIYGVLRPEVENALREHLLAHKKQQKTGGGSS